MTTYWLSPIAVIGAALLLAAPASGQVGETRVSIVVSPTFLSFAPEFGGGKSAFAGEVRVTRFFNRSFGAQLSGRAAIPGSQTSVVPSCANSSASGCVWTQSPSGIMSSVASLLGVLGETGLRASAGVGAFTTTGYRRANDSRASSVGYELGAEWVPNGRSRFTPTFAVRAVVLNTPIAGLRHMYLPGVGFTF